MANPVVATLTVNLTGDQFDGSALDGNQNTPIITSGVRSGHDHQHKDNLNSTPGTAFIIEFSDNPAGENEGKKLLGNEAVSTDAKGNVSVTFVPLERLLEPA